MKSIVIICALVTSTAAFATPVEQMVARGFTCNAENETHVMCRKDGEPSKICDAQGSCFRIIYESGLKRTDPVATGSVTGYNGARN